MNNKGTVIPDLNMYHHTFSEFEQLYFCRYGGSHLMLDDMVMIQGYKYPTIMR